MLRIDQAPEPAAFKDEVENPGSAWLRSHPTPQKDEKLPDYWRACADNLYDAYHGICAFTLMRYPKAVGMEVDHFLPKSEFRDLAYKWSNFRLVAHHINQKKWAHLVADPFKIPKDAFYIDFTDGKIHPEPKIYNIALPKVCKLLMMTLDKLALNDEGLPESRKEACDDYLRQPQQLGVERLTMDYPFVAYEMLRQGKLKEGDRNTCRSILKSIGFSWITI